MYGLYGSTCTATLSASTARLCGASSCHHAFAAGLYMLQWRPSANPCARSLSFLSQALPEPLPLHKYKLDRPWYTRAAPAPCPTRTYHLPVGLQQVH